MADRPARERQSLRLRPVTPADREFLRALYRSTREQELAPVPWTEEAKRVFLDSQFDLQDAEYRRAYPAGHFDVIELDDAPVGRLYVHEGPCDSRIVDLALVPESRGKGIGTQLLAALAHDADRRRRTLSIHVESFNLGARRLYERIGFVLSEDKGVYLLLLRQPGKAGT